MGGEVDTNGVPDVEPFGMMVLALRDERCADHEPERGDEIGNLVRAIQLAAFELPTRCFVSLTRLCPRLVTFPLPEHPRGSIVRGHSSGMLVAY